MPYKTKQDLPSNVKDNLPSHAEEIYQKAYNSAWDQYASPSKRVKGGSRDEVAHKVAWSAVKKAGYEKSKNGEWVKE